MIAAILLALVMAQDPERLIRDLDDDDVARREQAMSALVERGEPALPFLRNAALRSPTEGRLRAIEAIARIERQARIRERCPAGPTVAPGPERCSVAEALSHFTRETGYSIACPGRLGERLVRLPSRPAAPMEYLDLLCAAAGEARWELTTASVFTLREAPPVPGPFVYEGRLRFSLPTLDVYRSRQGDSIVSLIRLRIQAEHDGGLRPSAPPRLQVDEVLDESGTPLLPLAAGDFPSAGYDPLLPDEDRLSRSKALLYRSPGPGACTLASIRGEASYYFALSTRSLLLEDVRRGRMVREGAREISVYGLNPGSVLISVDAPNSEGLSPGVIDLSRVRIFDEDGIVYRAPFAALRSVEVHSGPRAGLHFLVTYDPAGRSAARDVALEIATDLHEMKVPFRFNGVPLP